MKRSRTKGSDGSDGLCQNVSFTPRSYLPIQPTIDEHFNKFVTTRTFQPLSSPEASPDLFSNHCFWCSPLVTDSRGYQGFTFPLTHCCLLKLFQGLSRPNFSPFEPSPIFSGGYHGRILTTCRLFDS